MKKAAFLLFAAACLTGSAYGGHGRSGNCCAPAPPSCNDCCDRPGLLDRLRACFQRDNCGDACAQPRCEPDCRDRGHRLRGLFHRRDDCGQQACQPVCQPVCRPACQPACRPANDCCDRPGLLDRLRSRFHRNDCCDNACGSVTTHKPGETIMTPPKKLPGGGKTGIEPPSGEVRIITPPSAPVPPPALIPAPGFENRSPF